jgi:salicylate hydroxylase
VASSRTILIAGAGIGGLTAALALAKQGFRAAVFEQSARLEEAGAGIQLTPNAMNVLLALGLGDALRPHVVSAEYIRIRKGRSGRQIVRVPLGLYAERRYGAPYWMIHRADLQRVLLAAAHANPDVALTLGSRIEDFVVHANGVTAQARSGPVAAEERGIGLVGADGLWSTIRTRLGYTDAPLFRRRTAWRAVVPADAVPAECRDASINLWLGRHAHLVHYPIRAGHQINIVAIVRDTTAQSGWSNAAARDEIIGLFRHGWAVTARNVVAAPERWAKWSLYDRPCLRRWGRGPITLTGDAAHPMLPFAAQGAAMAIEDAVVLASCMGASPDDPTQGMRRYETLRIDRTARAQGAASRNGLHYHASGVEAAVRNTALRVIGGKGVLRRYDWLYRWRAPDHEVIG